MVARIPRCSSPRAALILTLSWLASAAPEAAAQLISPGRLIAAHEELNGVRNCTSCHELRERGVSDQKCLECHELLRARIQERRGFHGGRPLEGCGGCHRDHFGADFDPIHFDTTAFDHELAGYRLAGSHDSVSCRDCHRREFVVAVDVREFRPDTDFLATTFLGLSTDCGTCHAEDDPHDGRYETLACADCHTEADWKNPELFHHDNLGAEQACSGCHAPDDPHGEQFGGRACNECHQSDSWTPATRFDHNDSRYRLTGAHVSTACEGCHDETAVAPQVVRYRLDISRGCASCHEDQHEGRMEGGCSDCHNTGAWLDIDGDDFESRFDHSSTGFELVGKHADTECSFCHDPAAAVELIQLSFTSVAADARYPKPIADACTSCHQDYHEEVFANVSGGLGCDNCHGQIAWAPTSFDIARHNRDTEFELTGAHAATPCVMCHIQTDEGRETSVFRFDSWECIDCHESDDPHNGQFEGRRCVECHDVDRFLIPDFDHANTRYALDGAHESLDCPSCHLNAQAANGTSFVVYRPLGTECRDCHGSTVP